MRSVPRHDRMAWATLIMIAALLAQFVLGMAANLFVTIPAHHPGASPNNYFAGAGHSVGWAITSGLLPLAAHVILGILLIVTGFRPYRPGERETHTPQLVVSVSVISCQCAGQVPGGCVRLWWFGVPDAAENAAAFGFAG